MKCALYARISVEERNIPKYSIAAQLERLEQYAKDNNLTIYDRYIDNGISAATINKRKDLVRLINDLDNIDIVLFTQLDRFSRNVLDANSLIKKFADKKVSFKAIDEDDVDTSTADGKFIFDLKVSLAERERKKTSERIKRVNEFKLKEKKALFGVGPTGYKLNEKKQWILSEDAPRIFDMFDVYVKTGSRNEVRKMLLEKYNIDMEPTVISHYLSKARIYTGLYKGIQDYYPRIISDEVAETTERFRKNNIVRNRSKGTVYIFRGLLRCKYCGHIMTGGNAKSRPTAPTYIIYRCNRKSNNTNVKTYCTTMHQVREKHVEHFLINNIIDEFNKYVVSVNNAESKKDPIVDVNKIKNKISRLQELYINGLIEMDSYKEQYETLNNELINTTKQESPKLGNLSKISDILNKFTLETYNKLDRMQKRYFWQSLIDYIEVDKDKNLKIYFK